MVGLLQLRWLYVVAWCGSTGDANRKRLAHENLEERMDGVLCQVFDEKLVGKGAG